MSSAATAADPHQRVQECVTFVAGLHRQVDAVLVAAGVDTICHVGIDDLLENVFGAGQPAFCANNDECWWLVNGLKNIIGAQVGS